MRSATFTFAILLAALSVAGCSGGKEDKRPPAAVTPPAAATPTAAAAATTPADDVPLPGLAHESELPDEIRAELNEKFTGDLDAMVKRRLVRVGVTYNRTHYFIEKGVQRGIAYEYIKLMEDELNKRRKTGNLRVAFWPIPLPRDQLLPALVDGKLDMVLAQLTVTPERQKIVDFSNPTREGVDEIVVTGAGAPPINSVEDLSGQEVFVRTSSSYYQSLLALNERLKAAGKAPVMVQEAPDALEDDDLLEMTNAGLVNIVIVDNYLAQLLETGVPEHHRA